MPKEVGKKVISFGKTPKEVGKRVISFGKMPKDVWVRGECWEREGKCGEGFSEVGKKE